jgi:uncharacterized protein YbjT (DUF2867 family)
MTNTTVAVFGATGNLGIHITNALLTTKHTVVLVTRPESLKDKKSTFDELQAKGARIATADLKNEDSVAKALEGVHVVVSAIGGFALADQLVLIAASKKAGVTKFYPSEFGVDTVHHDFDHPLYALKTSVRQKIIESGMQCVVFATGFFMEWAISPFYSFDFEKKTVDITGDGNQKISFTALSDIGKFVAHSIDHPLLKSDATTLQPQPGLFVVPVVGQEITLNELLAIYERKKGIKFTPTFVSIQQEKQAVAAAPNPFDVFGKYLRIWQAEGTGLVANNAAKEFTSIKPLSFDDIFSQ